MKNILLLLSVFITGNVYAGAVGGGGTSGLVKEDLQEIMRVLKGANKISREKLGAENLFRLDMRNRVVTFDADREILEESATLPFEEVANFASPAE